VKQKQEFLARGGLFLPIDYSNNKKINLILNNRIYYLNIQFTYSAEQ
jgi:hypothetical protein